MENRKFTPKDIIEGQLPVQDIPTPAVDRPHHILHKLLHNQVVFEARRHITRRMGHGGR